MKTGSIMAQVCRAILPTRLSARRFIATLRLRKNKSARVTGFVPAADSRGARNPGLELSKFRFLSLSSWNRREEFRPLRSTYAVWTAAGQRLFPVIRDVPLRCFTR